MLVKIQGILPNSTWSGGFSWEWRNWESLWRLSRTWTWWCHRSYFHPNNDEDDGEGACSGKTNQFHQNRLIEKSFQKGRIGGLGLMRVNWIIAQLHQRQWNQKEFQHVSDTDDASKHGHDFGFLWWWWFDDCYLWDLVQVCVEIFLNFAWRLQLLCFYVYIMSFCVFINIHTSQFSNYLSVKKTLPVGKLLEAGRSSRQRRVNLCGQFFTIAADLSTSVKRLTEREECNQYELTSSFPHRK